MNMQQALVPIETYIEAFRGRFVSLMRWDDLTAFWEILRSQADDSWYIYHVGDTVPESTTSKEQLLIFITEIDTLLRAEHDEDYCAIVYADDHQQPGFIKIFDPHNLGVSCGFSDNPPLPGWVLSKIAPLNLQDALKPNNSRRRWWQKIFD